MILKSFHCSCSLESSETFALATGNCMRAASGRSAASWPKRSVAAIGAACISEVARISDFSPADLPRAFIVVSMAMASSASSIMFCNVGFAKLSPSGRLMSGLVPSRLYHQAFCAFQRVIFSSVVKRFTNESAGTFAFAAISSSSGLSMPWSDVAISKKLL